nr:immunoglobulin heavy chain junction region [Mus musculus]MBK4186058.1 immunoglobulin heavy chain junction region [Mus musculus]
CARGDYDFDYW